MDNAKNIQTVFNKYAAEYAIKYMIQEDYLESFQLFCKMLPKPDADVLEIGCGPGNTAKQLLKLQPKLQLMGIDLASSMIELAIKSNPGASFQLMDAREIEQLQHRFDGIFAAFCLPYLSKEEARKLIADAAGLLKSGGVLYLSTMEGDYEKSGWRKPSSGKEEGLYTYYYEAAYLEQILGEKEFDIIHLDRIHTSEKEGMETSDLLIVAKKKQW